MAHINIRVNTTVEGIAEMMHMSKEEVEFFPKLGEVRTILQDYNYSILNDKKAAEKITALKETLGGDEVIFIPGMEALIAKFIY